MHTCSNTRVSNSNPHALHTHANMLVSNSNLNPNTTCRLEPSHREEYIAYLRVKERWGEAARQLCDVVNDDTFRSLEGKSKHNLWLELCDIVTKHPEDVRALNVDAIIRGGIRKFTNEVRVP